MNDCYLLNSNRYETSRMLSSLLLFKCQNIFDPLIESFKNNRHCIIGAELLVDFQHLKSLGVPLEQSNELISSGEAAHSSLDYASTILGKEVVFVNVERCNLCDMKILKRIITLSNQLLLIGIELVIEITERNFCGICVRVVEGLTYLKENKVKLAADDFDYIGYKNDSKEKELVLYYDYIKLEMPVNEFERMVFNDFIDCYSSVKRIIVERVETTRQMKSLPVDKLWGVQGFLFCKGYMVPRISFSI